MTVPLDLRLLEAGSCSHPERIVRRRGRWAPIRFPATVGVLRHPDRGWILFDAGYSPRFFELTRRWPWRLYRWVTPVRCGPRDPAVVQLRALGIDPDDVALIVVSHAHADHVGGLRDFPRAQFACLRAALEDDFRRRGAWASLRSGRLPGLFPDDFEERTSWIENAPTRDPGEGLRPYDRAFDLLGDGSLLGVDLSGHAPGQLGLALRTPAGREVFLVADACWHHRTVTHLELPHGVARLLTWDHRRYLGEIRRLHELSRRRTDLEIVPSHCAATLARLQPLLEAESASGPAPASGSRAP